jgi:hypothetical protein
MSQKRTLGEDKTPDHSGLDNALKSVIDEVYETLSDPAGVYHRSEEYRAVMAGRRDAPRRGRRIFFRFFRFIRH